VPELAFEPTPNPHAVKCVTPVPLVSAPAPFRSLEAAAGDDPARVLARALLSIPGVAHVLLHPAFVTIARTPEAKWSSIKPRVKRVLESALDGPARPSGPADASP
jgi:hypothetical protein